MFQPFGNTTVLPRAEWHPEPRFRGTFSILSSCLITMSLCIWTSLHLNVPEHKKKHLHKYRKLGWMVLGLLVPELVVWNAWEQRKQAKELSAIMQRKGYMPVGPKPWGRFKRNALKLWHKTKVFFLLKAEDVPELTPQPRKRFGPCGERIHAWTDVHSWLVVMGGLAFEDTAPEDQQFMPRGRQRVLVASTKIELLIRNKHLLTPDISREQLEDKSKSDMLGKMLTCWQAGYFCVQCIFRLSKELSITLLELNVFAHAICALLLFLIWWDKPRDVQEPLIIRDEEALDICAYLHSILPGRRDLVRWQPIFQNYSPNDYLEVSRPTNLTLKSLEHNYFAIGPNEYPYLKVRGNYWMLSRVGTVKHEVIITLDHRDINRLDRANRVATQGRIQTSEYHNRSHFVPDRVPNWSLSELHIPEGMRSGQFANLYSREFFWLSLE